MMACHPAKDHWAWESHGASVGAAEQFSCQGSGVANSG